MTSHPSQEAKINNNIKKIWKNVSLFFSSSSLTSSEEWHAPFESEWRVPPRAPSPHRRYWPEKYIKKKDGHSTAETGSRVVLTISLRDKYIPRLRVCVCVYYLLVKKEDARRRRRRRRAISIDSIQRWSPRVASCAASSSPAAATAQTHKSRRIKKGTHSTFPAQSRLLNSTQLNSNLNLI